MKKVRRGHRLHVLIYMCLFIGLFIAEYFALKSLFNTEPYSKEVVVESIEIPIKETNEIVADQGTFTHTRDVQMNVNEFTYEEAQLLLKVAQAEAGNQGEDGMWLVMSVVLNRVDSSEFPDSISEVIYQKHQFSTVSNNSLEKADVSTECHKALARIESGDVAPEIIAFETTDSTTLDKYFRWAFNYRNHQFYTLREE